MRVEDSREYQAIAAHYGTRTARRSGVPLMQHIDEGLWVLAQIQATARARRAYCLHPLVQADADLVVWYPRLDEVTGDPQVLALALEYRRVANATLSTRAITHVDEIERSPLVEVTQMLVADKVQNRKDFLLHHRATHPRRDALDRYFRLWLAHLGVTEVQFDTWFAALRG